MSNGLGSDAFAILWDGKAAARPECLGPCAGGLDARVLPQEVRRRRRTPPKRGIDSVTVPGAVGGLGGAVARTSASCPSPTCWSPPSTSPSAATWLPVVVQQQVGRAVAGAGRSSRASRRRSCPTAARRSVGELFAVPAAAKALRLIAETKGEAFYRGEIAEARGAVLRRRTAALITASDLAGIQARVGRADRADLPRLHAARDPAERAGHRGADGAGHPGELRPGADAGRRADSQHLQIEAMKLAFADVYQLRAPSARTWSVDAEQLLDDAYLASRRQADRHEEGAGLRRGQRRQGRHHLPHRRRRERHDGQLHPEQLHGLRLGRASSRRSASACRTAATASACAEGRQPGGAGQAAVPHDHPGLPHARTASPSCPSA